MCGKQQQAGRAPGWWLTAPRARGPVSPETGLNGSSKAALALPGWKAEPDKGRHCVLLQRPRGRPSMGPQTGTRPGSRPCNSRQASALRGKNFSLPSQKEICALILVCQNVNCLACVCLCVYFKKKNYNILEKEMATHSSILAWEILWTEEPGRLQSGVAKESDTT